MKDWIQKHYPEIIEDLEELQRIVQEAWEVVGRERLAWLVSIMPRRMQEVIDRQGWSTVW
jgi:hypothetical protein